MVLRAAGLGFSWDWVWHSTGTVEVEPGLPGCSSGETPGGAPSNVASATIRSATSSARTSRNGMRFGSTGALLGGAGVLRDRTRPRY
jgi:hypothetical protein